MTNEPSTAMDYQQAISRRPIQYHRGLCGLQNMGNTCFMNSALQCLSNIPELTEYFISGKYIDDICDQNPLGTQGRLAKEYAELLKNMWSGHHCFFRPFRIKCVIGMFAPRFNGFSQQDSHELTAFLLDGLHEDLNRVKKKMIAKEKPLTKIEDTQPSSVNEENPIENGVIDREENQEQEQWREKANHLSKKRMTSRRNKQEEEENLVEQPESTTGNPEEKASEEIAEAAWLDYKKCNDSIIADLLHGQLRSSLTCNVCCKMSVKFDPFCFLSLPIPPRTSKEWSAAVGTTEKPEILRVEARQERNNENSKNNKLIRHTEIYNEYGRNGSDLSHAEAERCAQLSVSQQSIYAKLGVSGWEYLLWFLTIARDLLIRPWTNWATGLYQHFFTEPISLEQCLYSFFSIDYLNGDDMYSCEQCKRLQNGTKQCSLIRLPEVLIIHLKRFRSEGSYNVKLSTKVTFPICNLDMRPFMHAEALRDTAGQPVSTRYDLCGVITHKGQNMEYGHYVAYCQNPDDQEWYEFDDSSVTRVSNLEVLSQEAYVLFYKRNDTLGDEDEMMTEMDEEEDEEYVLCIGDDDEGTRA